ncbi:MAG: tetraacyldisaccharide 4'-kinase, partial [Pseudomonadota bacterium]|nr:tetraacyldisaccharide 4'-kinase [Pseudomonadota bacterium]
GPKRVNSAKYLLDNFDCDVLITDDGLQHYALGRDIEIAMVDGIKKFGNQLTLPAGPLREPVNRLEEVDFVINTNSFFKNESQRKDNEYLMKYKPISWVNIYTKRAYDIQDWPFQKMVHAVAGISNPNNFFSSLRSLGFDVIEHIFPDHYNFSKNDFEELNNLPVVMTEKDAVKCEYLNDNFWYLKIEAQISDNLEKEIVKKIKS